MTHYAHILTLEQLDLMAHVGFYDEERGKRQHIQLSFRIYFESAPACCSDDFAAFLDYGKFCDHITRWSEAGEFRLIEYMGMQAYHEMRRYLDAEGYAGARLWVKLVKMQPPIPNLKGGSSFVYCDLPVGATTVFSPIQ